MHNVFESPSLLFPNHRREPKIVRCLTMVWKEKIIYFSSYLVQLKYFLLYTVWRDQHYILLISLFPWYLHTQIGTLKWWFGDKFNAISWLDLKLMLTIGSFVQYGLTKLDFGRTAKFCYMVQPPCSISYKTTYTVIQHYYVNIPRFTKLLV